LLEIERGVAMSGKLFRRVMYLAATVGMVISFPGGAHALDRILIRADRDHVAMGRTVQVDVTVTRDNGQPAPERWVLAYVNGKRWGAHEVTDEKGRANMLLPLPNPGSAEIRVQIVNPKFDPHWIWGGQEGRDRRVWLRKAFKLEGAARQAVLRVAVGGNCKVYLNGRPVGGAVGFREAHIFQELEQSLRAGENTLAVEASTEGVGENKHNFGIGGFSALLDIMTEQGEQGVVTNDSWQEWETEPSGWPATAQTSGNHARDIGSFPDAAAYNSLSLQWPGVFSRALLFAGTPVPGDATLSNAVTVHVTRRTVEVQRDPDHLIGMEYLCLFSPIFFNWSTAEAVPIVGFYNSDNPDVARQHMLWLMDAGVNWLLLDWSNQIWGKKHWAERDEVADRVIHDTSSLLEVLAKMRDEGLPVPQVVILTGLINGPPTTMQALNEEHEWIYQNFVRNPRFNGLWVEYEGKPLLVSLDTVALAMKKETGPVDQTHFTVRWMAAQLQDNHFDRFGYWTWMDGSVPPIVTYHNGKPEAVTVSDASFDWGGWTGPNAHGRRSGWTFIESFKAALERRPRFILLNEWHEFAGGAKDATWFGDSYTVELSNDIEPTSLTTQCYWGEKGGWGFYYLNLAQALIRVFHQQGAHDTVMAVYQPARGQKVTEDYIDLAWTATGKVGLSPWLVGTGYTILLDGAVVAKGWWATTYRLHLGNIPDGAHTVTVVDEGATTRFPLSYTETDTLLDSPVQTKVEVPFTLRRQP
jgi:hypothetical protein